jgi:hypothetical protein
LMSSSESTFLPFLAYYPAHRSCMSSHSGHRWHPGDRCFALLNRPRSPTLNRPPHPLSNSYDVPLQAALKAGLPKHTVPITSWIGYRCDMVLGYRSFWTRPIKADGGLGVEEAVFGRKARVQEERKVVSLSESTSVGLSHQPADAQERTLAIAKTLRQVSDMISPVISLLPLPPVPHPSHRSYIRRYHCSKQYDQSDWILAPSRPRLKLPKGNTSLLDHFTPFAEGTDITNP